jgi:hypothetical protein
MGAKVREGDALDWSVVQAGLLSEIKSLREQVRKEQIYNQQQGDKLAMLEAVEPMTDVADRYAHRMAMVLECVLMDRASDRWWNEAMQVLSEYRTAMNAIHEQHSPTHMGEPLLHNAVVNGG